MRGFIEHILRRQYLPAHEFLSRAIEVIEWGRTVWKDVPTEERGAIFEATFLRSVRALHLEVSMSVRL